MRLHPLPLEVLTSFLFSSRECGWVREVDGEEGGEKERGLFTIEGLGFKVQGLGFRV